MIIEGAVSNTRCVQNSWWFLKFEKQCASYASLSYLQSSRTMMTGV